MNAIVSSRRGPVNLVNARAGRLQAPLFVLLLLAALLGLGVAGAPAAQAANGDSIRSYRVDYTLLPDGTLKGRDTIEYSFAPTGERRHGIYAYWTVRRDIEGQSGRYRFYDMSVDSVSSPSGASSRYQTRDVDGALRLQIGDSERTVSGTQTYVIDYTVRGVVNNIGADGKAATDPSQATSQEFYVNPVAPYWEAPIGSATVTVTAPAASTGQRCFVGRLNSSDESRCRVTTSGDTITYTAVGELGNGVGMTVLAGYPANTVSNAQAIILDGDARGGPSIDEVLPSWAQTGLTGAGLGAGALAVVGSIAGMTVAHRRQGRDEQYAGLTPGVMPVDGSEGAVVRGRKLPVAVRFEPPENSKPGLIGTLIDEQANTVDVSATLIDLAVRGYLRIEETKRGMLKKDDWRFVRTEPASGTGDLLPYERKLYDGVFRKGDEVTLSSLKDTFSSTLEGVQKGLYRQVVEEGWFKDSPEKTRNKWMWLGIVLGILGIFGLVPALLVGAMFAGSGGVALGLAAAGGGLLIAAVIVMGFAGRMPARTARGSAMLAQARGFEQYLKTAEANQIKFEEAQNIFSRYLPYAIIFGCSERWAKVFDDVVARAGDMGYAMEMPAWYVFYHHNMAWNFMMLADSLDSFSTTAAGTFTSVPSSSSSSTPGSSGGSGFSMGGGFSGGGGFGGGGGGSW